jgi:predicted phosphodiesterase
VSQAYPSGYFALTADVRGDTIRAYLNGALILQAVDDTYAQGRVGMMSYANSGVYYDNLSVTGEVLIYEDVMFENTYPVVEDRAPYLQLPTQTSIMVAWRTVEENLGIVKYSEDKDVLDHEAAETEARQKHHVHLTDLEPGTRYHYEVYSGGERVQAQERFRTAPGYDAQKFSFLVLGDSGVDTPTQWALGDEMVRSMQQSEVDFMVHVGDVHQGAGDYYDNIYFKPYQRIVNKINVFTSLGNHDVITDNGGVYLDDFYLPTNNPDSTERYYSFRWANAYFIALDTNGDYSPGSPQYDWLVETLNDSLRQAATWTFVYAHHPPYSEYWTNYYGEEAVQDYLVPLFEAYNVDMVMNGHTHSYERGEKNHVHYVVTGGGGGNLDDYFIDYDHISFSEGVHHFTRIDVDGDEMWVSAVDEHGQQVDRFLINKYVEVGVVEGAPAEDGPALLPGYPNPARESATFSYRLSRPGRATLELFDMLGRKVGTLVDRRHQAGTHQAVFDASSLAPGVYLLRFQAHDFVQARTLTVLP